MPTHALGESLLPLGALTVVSSLLVPNPRIYESVTQIYQGIDDDVEERNDEDRALHHGIVAFADALEEQGSESRPLKDFFGDNCPSQEGAKLANW